MNKKKRRLKISLSVLLAAFLLYGIGFFVFVQTQTYNPFRNLNKTNLAYQWTTELLCPENRKMYINVGLLPGVEEALILIRSKQRFTISEWRPDLKDDLSGHFGKEYSIEGMLEYKPNKTVLHFDDEFNIPETIKPQSYYSSPGLPKTQYPIDDGYYNFYFGFDEPMHVNKLFDALKPLIDDPLFGEVFGVQWIPIQTSDYPQVTTLGIRGNLMPDYVADGIVSPSSYSYSENRFDQSISYFTTSLSWLSTNPLHAEIALTSGLYGETVAVNYVERLNYINQYGCNALGVVIFSDVRCLGYPSFKSFNLIEYKKI